MTAIPPRFAVTCAFCKGEIDSRADGIFQFASGWVMQRSQGGGNAIALPQRANRWACASCIRSEGAGTRQQKDMFS